VNQHWARVSERGSLLGLRFMLVVYRTFGRWLFQPICAMVVGYFALTSTTARRSSREFLDRVWVHTSGCCGLANKPTSWTAVRHFYNFAEAILDKIAAWQGAITYQQVDHENLALFESRYREGRGGVWVTSHLGNVEVCRAIGQKELDLKLTVLMHTQHAANFNRLLKQVAPDSNVELLEVTEFDIATALKLRSRIDKGRFIVIVGDRTPVADQGRTLECSFLGHPARFPSGPFLLAALLGCPAGTLFCVREGRRFRIFFDDLPGLIDVRRSERYAAIDAAARTFAARLEALCIRYPLQWFNFYPFWGVGQDAKND
jgi:predicted LPLAT superfamily acyltransferase